MCTKEMTLGEEIINLSAKGVDISTVERIYKKYINQCKSEDITVGDQIKIPLEDLGTFTATVHNITDDKVLFIFDDYVARRRINNKNVNKGGYGESDLKEWIDMKLFNKFPLEFRKNMSDLTIPTVGQILGWDDEWCRSTFEYDDNEQFLSMKSRRNRVAYYDNKCSWGWLRNAAKKEIYTSCFAYVDVCGNASNSIASNSGGVRPEFLLDKTVANDVIFNFK